MKEVLSDRGFRLMTFVMKIMDFIHPQAAKRSKNFEVEKGMTVVDYGCGPGRYTLPFSKLVGEQGKVIATDLNHIAEKEIEKKVKKHNLSNVEFQLAEGYNSNINSNSADRIIALDMFFMIEEPTVFLIELSRICKDEGVLIIDDGHQSRKKTRKKIQDSGVWKIIEERKDFLKCKKVIKG